MVQETHTHKSVVVRYTLQLHTHAMAAHAVSATAAADHGRFCPSCCRCCCRQRHCGRQSERGCHCIHPVQIESLRFDRRGNLLATYNNGVRWAQQSDRLLPPCTATARSWPQSSERDMQNMAERC